MKQILELLNLIEAEVGRQQSGVVTVSEKLRDVHFEGLAKEVSDVLRWDAIPHIRKLREHLVQFQNEDLRKNEELSANLLQMLLTRALGDAPAENLLKDPNAIHISMLHGAIARPSISQIEHIYQRKFEPVGNHIED